MIEKKPGKKKRHCVFYIRVATAEQLEQGKREAGGEAKSSLNTDLYMKDRASNAHLFGR